MNSKAHLAQSIYDMVIGSSQTPQTYYFVEFYPGRELGGGGERGANPRYLGYKIIS